MKPQISEGFGSEWFLIHSIPGIIQDPHGKEGVAVILFPETDEPSFLAVKRLYEALPPNAPLREKLYTIITRIEKERQDIMEADTWEGANAWEK